MQFIIGQVIHETNTFSSLRTAEPQFRETEWAYREQLAENHRGVRDYAGGMLSEAERLGIGIIPIFGTAACPSGIIAGPTYETIKRELLAGIERTAAFDAICLALHGAGVAEGVEDIEGDLLQAVRRLVGREVPIVVTLDLHANVTPLMVEQADVIVGNYLYPHTDSYECGQEAIVFARRMVEGSIRPVMRLVKPPLMIPTIGSSVSPINTINECCRQYEQEEHVLDCTFYHGFPLADIAAAGVAVLTITNGQAALAERIAAELAGKVMEWKISFFPKYPSPAEGIALALQSASRPVVINETSDNPGAGTPGDGTHLLRAMLEHSLQDACMAFICDPETAEAAHQAGAGAWIDVRLGGKTDTMHGSPLHLRVYVKALTDGKFITSSPMGKGTRVDLGKSARLQAGGCDIIVCSVRNQVFDEQIFLLHGIDVRQMKIVALKSSQHFRASFEPLTDHIITVDSPGLSRMDFTSFPYQRVRRPIYPLDAV
ncbi:MAG: M81 family metallopeptidase [Paenibacillaceae bacterium]|nr:M81 family metallopeptidase [Paenibacillaceae bacterium]